MQNEIVNINKYLNSKDISAHCIELAYSFDIFEKFFIIYNNKDISLLEKIDKYTTLLHANKDKVIKNSKFYEYDFSGKYENELLQGFIDAYKMLTSKILECRSNSVYRYLVTTKTCSMQSDEIFLTYKDALDSLEADYHGYDTNIINIYIEKIYIFGTKNFKLSALLNHDYEINQIYLDGDCEYIDFINDKNYEKITMFDFMYYNIPIPFKKHDIVTLNGDDPFLCLYVDNRNNNDNTKIYGISIDDNFNIVNDWISDTYNVSFADNRVNKRKIKLLTLIDEYLTSDITVSTLETNIRKFLLKNYKMDIPKIDTIELSEIKESLK